MASAAALSGRLALVAGLTAAALGAFVAYENKGLQFAPDLEEVILGPEELLPNLIATLLFEYATPLLCFLAFFFGLRAIRLWTGRIGFAAGGVALVAYLAFLRACSDAFMMAS